MKREQGRRTLEKQGKPLREALEETTEISERGAYSTIMQWGALYPHAYGDRIVERILHGQK